MSPKSRTSSPTWRFEERSQPPHRIRHSTPWFFLYKNVLNRELGDFSAFARARRPKRLPVVLTEGEVRRVLEKMDGALRLVASLLYGSDFRLMEALLGLRIKDVDFGYRQLLIRDAKGGKDRITMLPESLLLALRGQVEKASLIHRADVVEGHGEATLPGALVRLFAWPQGRANDHDLRACLESRGVPFSVPSTNAMRRGVHSNRRFTTITLSRNSLPGFFEARVRAWLSVEGPRFSRLARSVR